MSKIQARLQKVLMQDKSLEPLKILPALKSDLKDLISNFGELEDDVNVIITENDYGYQINIDCKVVRFKFYGF